VSRAGYLALAALAIAGCGRAASAPTTASAPKPASAAATCVSRWNTAARSEAGRQTARVAVSDGNKGGAFAKVTAGVSPSAPETCLITIANPKLGFAEQWAEASPGRFVASSGVHPMATLPGSAAEWNAYTDGGEAPSETTGALKLGLPTPGEAGEPTGRANPSECAPGTGPGTSDPQCEPRPGSPDSQK
jgi:hypothetical protein